MTKALPNYSAEVFQLTEAYFLQVSISIPSAICNWRFSTCAPTRRKIQFRKKEAQFLLQHVTESKI
jgi:hypothetical protein